MQFDKCKSGYENLDFTTKVGQKAASQLWPCSAFLFIFRKDNVSRGGYATDIEREFL